MTNLDAMIMTNRGVGGTIHQFARAFGVDALQLTDCDLSKLADEKAKGDFKDMCLASFLRQAVMNKRGMLLNGKPQTSKFDILAGVS